MGGTVNNQADPKETQNALNMWHGFTKVMTWGVIGVAALLLLMLIFVY